MLSLLLLAAPVDFSRDVMPILADACFHCHGPDARARQAGLRLDTKEGAFRKRKKHAVLVPGKPDESELVRRLLADDESRMPPADSGRKVTAKQRETLVRWVKEGAKWSQHWAFAPLPRSVPVPEGEGTPIDRFIRARLAKEGLEPSLPASRERWLRRVSLDLTGLPPTVAEIDAFLKDGSQERVVDRLLASPRHGERLAADWLDLARYADTHGYQSDRARPMWPYRDWAIRALNEGMPFDRFLTEQLAGDLLPKATKAQRLATAFNRLHNMNEEGGIVEEEFRVAYVVDRVNTMGTAFMGMTFECSRCHDHKFDPVTQKDYYSLFAFFQNIDESGQTSYFTDAMPVPTLLLSTESQDKRLKELDEAIQAAAKRVQETREKARPAFDPGPAKPPGPVLDWTPGSKAGRAVESPGAALSGENGYVFPGVGHFSRSDAFSFALKLKPTVKAARAVVLHHSRAPVDAGSRGYELLLEEGRVALGLHHMWPGNSLKVRTKKALKLGEWAHVVAAYDGSSRAAGAALYIDGERAEVEVVRDSLWKDITYGGEPDLALGFRFRDNGFKGGSVEWLKAWPRVLSPAESKRLAGKKAGTDFDEWAATHAPIRKAMEELRQARRAQAAFIDPIPEASVMHELPEPKPAFVLKRGAYDSPGEKVGMGTPAALPPFAEERNRLGLARWLTHPDHPLTARVAVNRLWQLMFGRGLVETSENFGTTGTPPTHPELLDWLARDLVAHGWDQKRTLRLIALSSTYRQDSRKRSDRDPLNLLLSRYPARRLSAEMLRDQALAVSGLLAERHGGPSVYP
ncbi:MAG: DUF1549 domain-containing protein, partial [Gemmataceae bacterium]|nr:DUF1549 domain-containing protein [Gemmataceae bacterium]